MRPTGYYWDSLAENIARKQRRSREKQKKQTRRKLSLLHSLVWNGYSDSPPPDNARIWIRNPNAEPVKLMHWSNSCQRQLQLLGQLKLAKSPFHAISMSRENQRGLSEL